MRLPCGGVRASAFLRPRTLISDNQVSRALNPYLHLNSHRDFLTVKFIFCSSIIACGFFSQVILVTISCLTSTHECRASGRSLHKTNFLLLFCSYIFYRDNSQYFAQNNTPTFCFIIHLNKMNDFLGTHCCVNWIFCAVFNLFLILRLSC